MGIVKARGPGVPKIQDSRSHLAETRGDPCTGSSARSGPDRVKAHFCIVSHDIPYCQVRKCEKCRVSDNDLLNSYDECIQVRGPVQRVSQGRSSYEGGVLLVASAKVVA